MKKKAKTTQEAFDNLHDAWNVFTLEVKTVIKAAINRLNEAFSHENKV